MVVAVVAGDLGGHHAHRETAPGPQVTGAAGPGPHVPVQRHGLQRLLGRGGRNRAEYVEEAVVRRPGSQLRAVGGEHRAQPQRSPRPLRQPALVQLDHRPYRAPHPVEVDLGQREPAGPVVQPLDVAVGTEHGDRAVREPVRGELVDDRLPGEQGPGRVPQRRDAVPVGHRQPLPAAALAGPHEEGVVGENGSVRPARLRPRARGGRGGDGQFVAHARAPSLSWWPTPSTPAFTSARTEATRHSTRSRSPSKWIRATRLAKMSPGSSSAPGSASGRRARNSAAP